MGLLIFVLGTQLIFNALDKKHWYTVTIFDLFLFSVVIATNIFYWYVFIGMLLLLMFLGDRNPDSAFNWWSLGLRRFVIGGYKEKPE